MHCNISTLYFVGHVGPFRLYPAAAYSIVVATSPDKLAMPRWRNNIPVQVPAAADNHAVAALLTTAAQCGRTILLFANHATFKVWQRALAEVLV